MIDVLVNDPFLFPVRHLYPVGDDLNGSVGAIVFADATAGTAMEILIGMRHDHFPFEPVEHLKFFPVFGVLLGDNFPRAEKVSSRHGHACKQ